MKTGVIILAVSFVLVLIGLGFIIYEKTPPAITIDTALSELGESGGTLYLKPGNWSISDKCVSRVSRREYAVAVE